MTSVSPRRLLVLLVLAGLLLPAGPIAGQGDADSRDADITDTDSTDADITYVERDVTESTTWSPDDGPYRVAADVTVREGATLTVEPGTAVQPAENVTITVRGNLTANGTAADPITFSTAPQAPGNVRWGTIRYDGTQRSRLSLAHATIQRAESGVTMTSSNGSVVVASSTIRTVADDGVQATRTRGTPHVRVTDSTFADVGGRGVALTPGTGAVADASITPNRTDLDELATHNVSVTPAVDTTFRTVRVEYRGHAGVDRVGSESMEWLGVDTDGDRNIDRVLNASVASVRRTAPDALELRLDRNVTVPGGASLVASISDVTNPRTYGTYPVEVRLRVHGVDQLAPTTVPLVVRSSGPRHRSAWGTRHSYASQVRITGSTFRSIDGQGVFVATDAASDLTVSDNAVENVRGSGVTVRAGRVRWSQFERNRLSGLGAGADGIRLATRRIADTDLCGNRMTGVDAGISLGTRNVGLDAVRVTDNAVTNSATGLRVRAAADRAPTQASMTVADNAFSENRRHGIAVTGEHAHLVGVDVRDNELAANGRRGLHVDVRKVARSTLSDNAVTDNERTGARLAGRQVRNTRVVDNEIADNGNHGVSVQTDLLVSNVSVDSNRVFDNAGVGLDLRNRLTHAGSLTVADNTVAANAYGVRVAGSLDARVRNNTVVYNTRELGDSEDVDGYENGTGIVVTEGERGALFRTDEVEADFDDVIDDPSVEDQFHRSPEGTYTVVLRPNRSGDVGRHAGSALSVQSVSADIPTGVALSKDDDRRAGVNVTGNDVYGHRQGLVVNVSALVDANTTARLLVDATRTVGAEHNYWGAPDGPTHDSIHPEGTGDRVVTRRGWVDFVPVAESAHGPRRHRPQPNLTVSPAPARPGETVVVSGRHSTDEDGTVATYQFEIDRTNRTTSHANVSTSFDAPGTYNVSLAVEDDVGVDSAGPVQRTIAVREPPETTTAEPPGTTTVRNRTATPTTETVSTTNGSTSPTTTGPSSSDAGPLGAVFGSLGGLLGLVFYGTGLLLGAYGTLQTFYASTVTVSGRRINGFAGTGVVLWVGFGLLGTDGLLGLGVGAAVLWFGLVALLWVLVTVLGR